MTTFHDKHRARIYDRDANEIDSAPLEVGSKVRGYSAKHNRPNARPLEFEVTLNDDGEKQFTRRKSPWWKFW